MSAIRPAPPSTKLAGPALPLENGDRLTRDEFERRYQSQPHMKAELLEGVVHVASPVRFNLHGRPTGRILTWLGTYEAFTPHVIAADNSTARLDMDNEVQPDALLLIDPATGGQAKISDDDYIEGAPEFVAEVAASSASIDLHVKKNIYRRNRVQEYLVWRVNDEAIDWFVLQGGEYILAKAENGILRSRTFPGLWLAAEALLNGDLAAVLETVRQGAASPEHAAFVQSLSKR